jgi:Rne/Rng family ribonuclease
MPKEMVISAAPHETRVAILEDGQLCEIYIEREKEFALVGSIYKGRVTRVLPGMQSAFVEIGLDSDAFLYVGDFLENLEDYDHVVTAVEGKVQKMEQQGGEVFSPPVGAALSAETPAPGAPFSEPAIPEQSSEQMASPQVESPAPHHAAEAGSQPAPGAFQRSSNFPRQERGPGNFGSGRNDRGGRRRGGGGDRFRRGGRGGRPYQGRDLPQSKYASPRPYTPRPVDPGQGAEEPPVDYEPVILPGESLAKYKDRMPASRVTPAEPPTGASVEPAEHTDAASRDMADSSAEGTIHFGGAPSPREIERPNLEDEREEDRQETWFSKPAVEPPLQSDAQAFSDYQALPEEPPRATYEPQERQAAPPALRTNEVSDEEMGALAEQLAEARHEEASAQAEADANHGLLEEEEPHAPESAAEAEEFVAEADAEEREDAAALHAEAEGGPEITEAEAAAENAGAEHGEPHPTDEHPTSARIGEPQRARFQRPMRRGGRHRGNRPMRRPDHRPQQQQQRRPQLISEMLKANQEIIVQIAKEPLGKKGARITSHVALPGRFLVYMPTVNHIGVSRRINSAEERSRLRRLVTEAKGTFPGGFIVRTAAEGAPDDEIRADVEFLGRTWDKIRTQGEQRKAPALLHRDLNLVERILRDYVSNDYTAIWIDNEEEFSKVVDFVNRFQPKMVGRVKLYTKPSPIFEEFGIQQELDKALRPKVWLKSGGYIVINHTEALVAIDVNTGKYVGRGSTRLEDTIVKTNLEAVKEIIRQIRLRDLGGIIVLDFIDMEERRNREKVMAALEAALRSDRAPSKALAFNEFGLVAITRKRTKQALERVLCQPCPYCTGSGMVKSVPTICYEIQAEARKMAADLEASSLTLRVHPEIAKALKTRESALIEELEQATHKSAIIQADPTLHWEQYDIY